MTQTKTDNKTATACQKTLETIWANRLSKAIGEREQYKAHADKMAEALVNALNIIASLDEDHYEFRPSFIAGHATLAAYESDKQ